MALPAAPGQPTAPGSMPAVGAGGTPGTPPMGGAGGATMPTPNRGLQAAGLQQLQWAVRLLEKILPMVQVESDVGRDVMKALTNLSKHLAPGGSSPGLEQSAMHKMMMEQRAEQPLLQQLRNGGGGEGGAPGGLPGGGGAAPSPMAA